MYVELLQVGTIMVDGHNFSELHVAYVRLFDNALLGDWLALLMLKGKFNWREERTVPQQEVANANPAYCEKRLRHH